LNTKKKKRRLDQPLKSLVLRPGDIGEQRAGKTSACFNRSEGMDLGVAWRKGKGMNEVNQGGRMPAVKRKKKKRENNENKVGDGWTIKNHSFLEVDTEGERLRF